MNAVVTQELAIASAAVQRALAAMRGQDAIIDGLRLREWIARAQKAEIAEKGDQLENALRLIEEVGFEFA